MQGHQRWFRLALVTIALVLERADAQVYTMRSDLDDEEPPASLHSGLDFSTIETTTPTAKKLGRLWNPITNGPSHAVQTTEDDGDTPSRSAASASTRAPPTPPLTEREKTPQTTTKAPTRAPPAVNDSLLALRNQEAVELEQSSVSKSAASSSELDHAIESTPESEAHDDETEFPDEIRPTPKKKLETSFTKSPYLQLTTPVPDGIHTADDEFGMNDSEPPSSQTADDESSLNDLEPPSSSTKPKTTKPQTKKKLPDSTLGSDPASPSTPSSKSTKQEDSPTESFELEKQDSPTKSSELEKQDLPTKSSELPKHDVSSGHQETDATKDAPTSKPPAPSTNSSLESGSSSSAASVFTDSASDHKPGIPNTLMLGLMMVGAVALVMLVAVFVYIKTREKDNDDEIDPVLQTVRHDGKRGTVQSSTVAANFYKNNNMSPTEYSDDNSYPNNQQHDHQYDQDAYGFHHGQGNSVKYGNTKFDVLTPQSQIALAHSQMSLPPMDQSDHSNGSSQYSNFTTQSDFYGNSAYSATSSFVSQVANNYPGIRKGKGENDIDGRDDESDYGGKTTHTTKWDTAGRAKSAMDRSMLESQFEPGDSRSTSASDYTGKNHFKDSEYTEYRMSTGYENSHVGGGQGYDDSFASSKSGYDNSFAASKSDYDNSFAASKSGYDASFAAGGGKSFTSSGFSEYENVAPPRPRSSNNGNSDSYRH